METKAQEEEKRRLTPDKQDRKPQAPSEASADDAPSPSFEVKDLNNTQLDTFFQGLMKKTKPADSPRS